MTNTFNKYVNWTLRNEGASAYTHIVRDGVEIDPETAWGITLPTLQYQKAINGDLNGDGIVNGEDLKELTYEEAVSIYDANYWTTIHDQVAERSEMISAKLFDTGVNMGVATGYKLFQQALNVTGKGDILLIDGKPGSKSLSVFTAFVLAGREQELFTNICNAQMQYYDKIIAAKPQKAMFRSGWSKRAYCVPEPNLTLDGIIQVETHPFITSDELETIEIPTLQELLPDLHG